MHVGWDANDDVADVGVERVPHEAAPLRKPKIAEVSAEIGSYDLRYPISNPAPFASE
jgi:hypothetical protein